MRNVIGFQKPQDPMGLQMVEGPGGGNGAWVYGGERGLREGLGSASQASCPTSLAGPAGLHRHTGVCHEEKDALKMPLWTGGSKRLPEHSSLTRPAPAWGGVGARET